MSIDRLQEKIRKMKNPSMVDFSMTKAEIPPYILEAEPSFASAWECYSKALLDNLKDAVPAVRFSMNMALAYGIEGVSALTELLRYSKKRGYYVLLDGPGIYSTMDAERAADALFSEDTNLHFDGLLISPYLGSDCLRPFTQQLQETQKDVFVQLRTPNRSAQELQDLLTGARLVHMAAADVVNRYAQAIGRSGYSQVAAAAASNAGDSLKNLRSKYKNVFLLVDGYDAPGANAKLCSNGFDKLGHGAVVCAGTSVTGAWKNAPWTPEDHITASKEAAERMKKNILRYITVL